MTWIRWCKQKRPISKISVHSNFTFSSYARLYVFHCSQRLLCWIKSRTQDFLWKVSSFHTEMISAQFLWGSVILRGELQRYAQYSNLKNFKSALYLTSGIMPLMLENALMLENCDKLMHFHFNFDAWPLHSLFMSLHLTHQNLSVGTFSHNSLAKVSTQLSK